MSSGEGLQQVPPSVTTASAVFTVCDDLGFLGNLHRKPVHCFETSLHSVFKK